MLATKALLNCEKKGMQLIYNIRTALTNIHTQIVFCTSFFSFIPFLLSPYISFHCLTYIMKYLLCHELYDFFCLNVSDMSLYVT